MPAFDTGRRGYDPEVIDDDPRPDDSRAGRWLHAVIDVPPDAADASAIFWAAALGWPLGPPWPGHPEFASFSAAAGTSYVHRQIGDHGPRTHLDLEVTGDADDLDGESDRLTALGATPGRRAADWYPMSSPGGLPFCLLRRRGAIRPGPSRWPGGHRSRLVQVCIDSPADQLAAEVRFWREATGWRWDRSPSDEFAGKLFPAPGSPIQLLLQRLDTAEPATRAHLDLATDDVDAEVRRLAGLGAERVGTGRGWVVMTDPVGMRYCVTGQAPD